MVERIIVRVHVFLICRTFREFSELRAFVEDKFNDAGGRIPSQFANEVGLQQGESTRIEVFFDKHLISVRELLKDASYSEKWLSRLSKYIEVDSAICVYDPNAITNPYGCGRERARYRGAFEF